MYSFYASQQFDFLHKLRLTKERSTLIFITAIGKQTAFVKLPIHYDKNGVDWEELSRRKYFLQRPKLGNLVILKFDSAKRYFVVVISVELLISFSKCERSDPPLMFHEEERFGERANTHILTIWGINSLSSKILLKNLTIVEYWKFWCSQ